MPSLPRRAAALAVAAILAPGLAAAQRAAGPLRSAPVSNLRYEVTFTAATARERSLSVALTFDAASREPVLLSLPAWTPGAYEVSDFAHWVSAFDATQRGAPVTWDKVDPDTWRVRPAGAGPVTVSFTYRADSLDNAMAWSRPDFAFFNGTNVFLYPEGRSLEFPATVTIHTDAGWNVATGMRPRPGRFTYGEGSYHDLVDMPFFVGRFDLDSAQVAGRWHRLATYPAGALGGGPRVDVWRAIRAMAPVEAAVFNDTPWPDYTTMMVFPEGFGGASPLEHARGQLDLYAPEMIGHAQLLDLTAHEMFHAWNVKRLRPAELWPYRYDRWMPTAWLWVSEGITDYYAPLSITRGGVVSEAYLWANLTAKMRAVDAAPPTALEAASLSTWIRPQDGTEALYYPKGALAGFLLDVMIRDASDNRRSLDTVMRALYEAAYRHGRGFTADEWWAAVSRAAGGRSFAGFAARYVAGRDPFPYAEVLPLAGLRLQADTARVPRLGMSTQGDSTGGVRVQAVAAGGVAERAGVQVGDQLLRLGDVAVTGEDFAAAYRERYGGAAEGAPFAISVRRDGREVTLNGAVHVVEVVTTRIAPDPNAGARAVRIRNGIARGEMGGG